MKNLLREKPLHFEEPVAIIAGDDDQTVDFELRIEWMHVERPASEPSVRHFMIRGNGSFEKMMELARKEKRRRARKDRATHACYRMHYTERGLESRKERRGGMDEHIVDGDWFRIF